MRYIILISLAVAVLGGGKPALAASFSATQRACADAVATVEKAQNLPRHLLRAISQVESGRWNRGKRANVAWPWTIYAKGKGRHYATKQKAVAAVRKLQRNGIRNIDVGCMQINLMYHPDAFTTLEDAFNPYMNVAYAGRFLASLRKSEGVWARAVAKYHSSNRANGKPYWKQVNATWKDNMIRAYEARQNARIKTTLVQRAKRGLTGAGARKARGSRPTFSSGMRRRRPHRRLY